MTEAKQPKSLHEMAAEADIDPWACPRCGCRDWRVPESYPLKSGDRRRWRECRHCRYRMRTLETPDPK